VFARCIFSRNVAKAYAETIPCAPEQVLITAGSQGALDLAARVLLDPGDTVWIEDPGYLGARGALLAAGAQVVPVPVDAEGIDVAAGQRLAPRARIVSVTPSHQFPTGVTISLSRRVALLEWARQAQAWVLEDDYDSEYRFSGRPLEALQGLDNGQSVIYIGTFSKVLFPTLRLGYLVVPPELVAGFLAMRRFIDVHVPILEQLALADFMAQGHFTRHLRHMRTRYTERRNALIEALARECGDLLDVHIPEAGMHLVAWLPTHMDDRAVARLALDQGIEIAPISKFCIAPPPRGGLMLGYANASTEDLRDGVRKLARALRRL
jgi:GntR family transcriptional regulator/MocR family aminotransferase